MMENNKLHDENLIPNDYWNELSDAEKEAMAKAIDEAEEFFLQNPEQWDEMDEAYYEGMRARFGKGPDDIGPRQFKTYMNRNMPIWMFVMPAGRQHNGENFVGYYHVIAEDMEHGECNGAYSLMTETELKNKYNITYNV
jgi:hypothetical protein